eukprot:gene7113-7917_t
MLRRKDHKKNAKQQHTFSVSDMKLCSICGDNCPGFAPLSWR